MCAGVEATRTEQSRLSSLYWCQLEGRNDWRLAATVEPPRADGVGVRRRIEEIEDEVAVFGDYRDAAHGFRGEFE